MGFGTIEGSYACYRRPSRRQLAAPRAVGQPWMRRPRLPGAFASLLLRKRMARVNPTVESERARAGQALMSSHIARICAGPARNNVTRLRLETSTAKLGCRLGGGSVAFTN